MNILIAEDDEYSAILLKEFLKGRNVNIHTVFNGNDAVEFCLNNSVNLVLMDIKLPKLNGIDAAKLIKKNKPELIVIAQTACITSSEVLNSVFDAYILKPFKKEDLLKLITNYK